MFLSRSFHRFWLVAFAITVCLGTIGVLGTPSDGSAQQRPNCGNFIDQEDALVALDADPKDPFGLDENNDGVVCQLPKDAFGTPPLVNCDDLRDHPDIALALYDHSLTKYGADRYDLAGCVEQASTGTRPSASNGSAGGSQSQGDDPEMLDGVPLETRGRTPIISPVALGTNQTLEARLEARFAALEAQFAAFEARVANGFGMFPESGVDATAEGPTPTVMVSTSQRPITMTKRPGANADNPIVRAQNVNGGEGDRTNERQGKRDRHKNKHRNRR